MSGSDRIRAWEYGSYSGDPQGVGEWYTTKIVVNNYVSFNYERCKCVEKAEAACKEPRT